MELLFSCIFISAAQQLTDVLQKRRNWRGKNKSPSQERCPLFPPPSEQTNIHSFRLTVKLAHLSNYIRQDGRKETAICCFISPSSYPSGSGYRGTDQQLLQVVNDLSQRVPVRSRTEGNAAAGRPAISRVRAGDMARKGTRRHAQSHTHGLKDTGVGVTVHYLSVLPR